MSDDWDGEERRESGVTQANFEALSEQIRGLDNTIKTLFLTKATAKEMFPNWREFDDRLQSLEGSLLESRRREFRRMYSLLAFGLLVWTPLLVLWL